MKKQFAIKPVQFSKVVANSPAKSELKNAIHSIFALGDIPCCNNSQLVQGISNPAYSL